MDFEFYRNFITVADIIYYSTIDVDSQKPIFKKSPRHIVFYD